MGRRPRPFISVRTVHEEGNRMAQVVLPRGTFVGRQTLTTYGANEEEAYRKAVMGALTSLSSGWEADHTVLRFLPTRDLDHAWRERRGWLRDRNGSRPLVACMDYAREAHGMYRRAENREPLLLFQTRTRVEELEARVAQLQQRLAEYEPPQQPAPLDEEEEESSEPMEVEEEEENDPSDANSRMVNTRQGQTSGQQPHDAPPPPELATLVVQQAELIRMMAEERQARGQRRAREHQPRGITYQDFEGPPSCLHYMPRAARER
ncbi:hypothetical protein U9M48_028293 [Paspalum notatum var. saurae]|uniref:Uncharacterized protein n=1 Tax=Paspalum notatum var. saurae TaxID=547442 RepID=A0AAQ3X052_PASNO